MTSSTYPGRLIQKGEPDKACVKLIQQKLNERGCGPIDTDGGFGPNTVKAVKLFQMRFTDTEGQPLIVDGKIGAVTWTALFGSHSLPEPKPAKGLLLDVLGVAITQIGVQERPPGSNRGPEVDIFLKTVGLNPAAGSYAWCAAFVYWCFKQVSDKTGKPVSVPKTAGVLNMWNKAVQAGIKHIDTNAAVNNPLLIKPGFVLVMSFGRGTGHTGFVEGVEGGKLITIEGNTNDGGSREGIGVFRRNSRKINQINKGFIDFG